MIETFFITGVSGGLGLAFAKEALTAGHRAVGTVRNPDQATTFTELAPGRAFARLLDVTDDAGVVATVDEVESTIAPIDVLITNAGYGFEGTVEESNMGDLRRQFDVNDSERSRPSRPFCPTCGSGAAGTSSRFPPWPG